MEDSLAFSSWIRFKGCSEHNLKNLSFSLPKHAVTVIAGISGSGKSSLAFDTLFVEGQRRYLEYLSSQTRLLIKQMAKPHVDLIEGLSPTLAVGQGRAELFSKGTVATYTDIYDFLALLYAKIGEQHSPITGKKLTQYSRQEIIHLILQAYPIGSKIHLLAPIPLDREDAHAAITRLEQLGFIRLNIEGEEWTSGMPMPDSKKISTLDVVIDRLEIKEGIRERLAPSIETALDLSKGILKVQEGREGPIRYFTEIYVCPETSYAFPPLSPADFNFNSPKGACPLCKGRGGEEVVKEDLLFKNEQAPLLEQAHLILTHLPKKISSPFQQLLHLFCQKNTIFKETTFKDLLTDVKQMFLYGSSDIFEFTIGSQEKKNSFKGHWQGFIPFLNRLVREQKINAFLHQLPFIQWMECSACHGAKLKKESLACLIQGENIASLCEKTPSQLLETFRNWKFSGQEEVIAHTILPDIKIRLTFLQQVGLGYLALNRQGNTLSDGEAQRIQLASQIGLKLSGLIYILDEPSLGLHRQDIHYLQQVIEELKELGNTIILVEHERGLISQADHILELGPGAGEEGGFITFQGSFDQMLKDETSLTGQWLSGRKTFHKPPRRKHHAHYLQVIDASLHHICHLNVNIPLGCLVGFCGVSGSGKSTLALDLIGHHLRDYLRDGTLAKHLKDDNRSIKRLILAEQLAERFSPRSIPATYAQLMTPLRLLFSETRLAKARGYTAARFSLNKRGGRCEACQGLGENRIDMQFMPNLFIPCDVCQGDRYNYETLQIYWENRNIAQVLSLSVDEACEFFRFIPTLKPTLQLMQEIGLGYLTLGQPFHTLSGGEIQRLRLVGDLLTKTEEKTLYILDEPSAGLHFEDIQKLLMIFHRLVDKGHSIFVIEHHLDILQQADWLIELGPEGGPGGGKLIFEGTPQQLKKKETPTGRALKAMHKNLI